MTNKKYLKEISKLIIKYGNQDKRYDNYNDDLKKQVLELLNKIKPENDDLTQPLVSKELDTEFPWLKDPTNFALTKRICDSKINEKNKTINKFHNARSTIIQSIINSDTNQFHCSSETTKAFYESRPNRKDYNELKDPDDISKKDQITFRNSHKKTNKPLEEQLLKH